MNIRFVATLAASILLAPQAQAETAFKPSAQQERDAKAMLASISLKELLATQAEILASAPSDQLTAKMLAGGALNEKFEFVLSDFVARGKATKKEAILGMSFALIKLSTLAQAMGLRDASLCHLRESRQMALAARGEVAEAPNCRNSLYTPEQQAAALKRAYSAEGKRLNELANRWATKAMMFGLESAKAENAE